MYQAFAPYYDRLTGEIDYPARGAYFDRLLRTHAAGWPERPILLDLGCGTGSLSSVMTRLGYDVIGVDGSPDMLCEAMCRHPGEGIQFICQNFTQLDLYGTIDAAICALDCLNHLPDEQALGEAIRRVGLFTAPGGVFVFDVNTPYKHREILAGNTFVYDLDDLYCVWQNATDDQLCTEITLDFFVREKDAYFRTNERFFERAWPDHTLRALLERAGFELLAVYAGDTEQALGPTDQRAVYLARKRAAS